MSNMTNDDCERLRPTVEKAARSLARENPFIETADIEQEIWSAIVSAWKHLENSTPEYAYRIAHRAGRDYCMRERYAFIFNSNQYVYTPKEVRKLLSAFFLRREDIDPPRKDDGISIASGGICIALWDMDDAFARLGPANQQLLFRVYMDGYKPDNNSADRKRVNRAIDELTQRLNTGVYAKNEMLRGWARGRTRTNAAAQALTREDY